MNSDVLTVIFKGDCLPLASLRLLVPPIQLMSACMWQFLKKQDVLNYWKVAEYVSLVMDMVPELLMYKHRMQLNLGLRARYILELCQSDQHMETDFILSQLEKIKAPQPSLVDMKGSGEEVAANFLELIQTLLKDPEERRHFFMEIFPAEYGPQYDHDLQTLFSEFLFRLNQLLPVPDLEQTVSWLGAESDMLDDCVSVSEPTVLIDLLQHHKHLGHLEQHGPPSSMGDTILSSLSAVLPSREMKLAPEQHDQPGPLQVLSDDAHTVMFEGRVAVEIVTVTDYAEVELGTDIEVVMGENCCEGTETITVVGDSVVMLPVEMTTGIDVEASEEEPASIILQGANNDDSSSFLYKMPVGPHDCPDCQKKFKFASSLMAHRVIHTGERPHRCNYCGRCFSFRQSLDRHRYTHRSGRQYTCIICGENFNSLSARTDHKQTHMKDGVYTCCQCSTKFKWELALARHLKCHNDDYNANKLKESHKQGEEVVLGDQTDGEAPVVLTNPDSEVEDKDDPEYVEVHSSEHPTSELKGMAPELQNEVISLVKVRTSGRKRKPTMKIQVINLQKSMTTKRRKIRETAAPELEHSLISCAEHSYGSSVVSSEQGDESSAADGSTTAFSCPMCSFHHSEEAQIQHHIDKLHSVEFQDEKLSLQPFVDEKGRFSCPDCNKSFKFQSILKAHQRIHTGEQPFLCSQCGRRFSFKQSLDRHKQTHKSGRKYECLICGEFFKSLVAQREHKSIHMENGDYVCSECGRAFTWKSALVRHLKIHCKGDEDNMESSYKCPYCDQSFSCASYLNKHLLTHQEERAHTCNCGKSFTYRASLTAHQRIHLKERPHTCKQCGKGFLYKGGLLSHTMTHSEDMPFMCSFCGKSFKRERSMKKHERCHTRENVFSCSQCDKSFVYKATLIRHELTHSGERPYLCSDCGKGFYSHAELLKHERFHTGQKPFQCPHCGKKFTQSCYLTIHLRYHTGVRPYSCTECDKRFLSANRLKRHQRTHSGEKPYLCVECGKGFRQAYNLKMHQRTHTMKLT